MATTYLGNAFSLQMLADFPASILVEEVTPQEVAAADFVSVIGHENTAAVTSSLLGVDVAFNRANVTLKKGDVLYVSQITGGRLPEGVTELPEGITIKFLKVTLQD